MNNLKQKAEQFRQLHIPGNPLVLFNIWDPGSATAVAAGGALAIATGSWAVAHVNGYADGEQVPLDLVIGNLERITHTVDLPVTVDLESGYGRTAAEVAGVIERSIRAGAIGCNLEDSFPENRTLRSVTEQSERIRHARNAADGLDLPYFINARTDIFFQPSAPPHDDALVALALQRAHAYAEAGADGLFVPGLTDERLIARLAAESPLPLNVMVREQTPSLPQLAHAGVARVSYGPGPYLKLMKQLEQAARDALGTTSA
ncbi:putative carboxyvinyl-carboxyphosphonate phosphorylmutase [Collimonas arenae]|uniref:Putative carboxyvinyl-carboxyphosphonate phosphorylmutase n=1 Tax=Collimonas arenae TaxID=279058 RepID=A0A0A1F3Y9_9BURK|nr:isocitrate lyase/phosphoenolpyruvate mutase family protein [Collimonas arenae]AIY39438.1 putative carboxyvinyl-carboxyphosphonate phosphorylmutase [Collimonas arenae]